MRSNHEHQSSTDHLCISARAINEPGFLIRKDHQLRGKYTLPELETMTESAPYTVTGTIGNVELRRYPELVLASVEDFGDDRGFQHLFRYITGNNRAKDRIAMTSPVITGEKIPMTAPVITAEQIPMTAPVMTEEKIPMTAPVLSVTGSMSFVMPAGRTQADLPEPLDNRLRLVTVPPREVAVLRFRGWAGRDAVNNEAAILLATVEKAGIRTKGGVFLMRYNPPWTPGFLRRNEVAIEIAR